MGARIGEAADRREEEVMGDGREEEGWVIETGVADGVRGRMGDA